MNEPDNQKDSDTPPLLWDTLLLDLRIATMVDSGAQSQGYGVIEQGAIGIQAGRIVWVGPQASLPGAIDTLAGDVIECTRTWVTPGLIDCYTHLIYAGDDHEHVGIIAEATRLATDDQLLEVSARRLVSLLEEGVTTVMIRSGYGLDNETEATMTEVARMLEDVLPMHLLTHFNGARTLPESFAGNREAFSEEGVKELAAAGQIALLLPGVFYTRGMTQKPLVTLLRQHNVPMLLSTGCNPITSPSTSLLLMLNMGCRLFGLTPQETLHGVTSRAAKALGVGDDIGTIEVGKMADLALWDIRDPNELSQQLGYNPCLGIVKGGILRRTRE